MRKPVIVLVLLFATFGPFQTSAEAAGVQFIEVPSADGTGVLEGAVWHPCAVPPGTVRLRNISAPGVEDCPVQGDRLPLVVISHGGRGWFGGHHDTAEVLADAGFVVAAVTHPDEGRGWQTDRPATIKQLIDHMLGAWPDHARLDANRIGLFGFSRGGYTGLVAIGGVPDFRRVGSHCLAIPDDPVCAPLPGRGVTGAPRAATLPPAYTHDPRVKAAVIAAPLGLVFSPEGLEDVTVPVQLWRPETDALARHPYNAEAVSLALPSPPDYRVVANAGHFSFLAPCTALQAQATPRLCQDAPGFDRMEFHAALNAEILAFFRMHLDAP